MNEYFGNLALEIGVNAVRKCAEKYGFDAEEAIELCGLGSIDNHVVFNKTKKGAAKKEPSDLQLKLAKPKYPFPYCGEYKQECCQGLKYNRGLFTQCLFIKTSQSDYCKRCSSQAENNEHGKPDCGSIQERLNIGFMDFRDPKGRAPISFVKVMRKLKISQEALLEEAGKFNFEIPSIHFVDPPPPGKKGRKAAAAATASTDEDETQLKKGRPSKKKEIVVSTFTEEADLFATLTKKAAASASTTTSTETQQQTTNVEPSFFFVDETKEDNSADNQPHTLSSLNLNSLICPESSSSETSQSTQSSQSTTPIMPPPQSPAPAPAPAPAPVAKETTTTKPAKKMTKEEKEAAKEAEKAAKAAEKAAAKVAAKEAEKAAKAAEKAAAKEAEKAAKKTKAQAEEKAPKKTKAQEAEAEAKKKAEAEAKKKAEEEEDSDEEDDDEDDDDDEEDEELAKQEEDEDKADELASVQLDRFKYAGKTYLKDQFGVIYDMGDGKQIDPYPIGKWNQQKRSIDLNDDKIVENDEGSDEEQEDEYED